MTSGEDASAASLCRSPLQTTENTVPLIAWGHAHFTLRNNPSRNCMPELSVHRGSVYLHEGKTWCLKFRK